MKNVRVDQVGGFAGRAVALGLIDQNTVVFFPGYSGEDIMAEEFQISVERLDRRAGELETSWRNGFSESGAHRRLADWVDARVGERDAARGFIQ